MRVTRPDGGPGRVAVDVWLLARPADVPPLAWLDGTERERAASLPPGPAAGFVAARRLLRAVLGDARGVSPAAVGLVARCPRCGGPHGPVRLAAGTGPHVSVTRSGPLLAVATADRPVGIDLEAVARVAAAPLADVALAPAERHRYDRLPASDRAAWLAQAWVRKEAVLKARGCGLAVDPSGLDLGGPASGGVVLAAGAAIADLAVGREIAGAVAVPGATALAVHVHDGAAALSRRSGPAAPGRPATG